MGWCNIGDVAMKDGGFVDFYNELVKKNKKTQRRRKFRKRAKEKSREEASKEEKTA